ncbi:psiF repeat-containing protein [Arboricoccus pini]|uniref:PsiF repeat-containing protein n=1 Tax=Arboricoccus pini TaxID=1963835 RepID=A0A212R6N5_9PROT|nr:PsiF family protein [Arboricoccus pini]SNB67822.1 psiF repeat-containing protein [Arboricoccus pini]
MRAALLSSAIALAAVLYSGLPDVAHAANSQQNKMTTCNADAKTKGLSGDARKSFMSTCLSSKATATTTDGSAKCAADADTKKLHGAARTSFIKKCAS